MIFLFSSIEARLSEKLSLGARSYLCRWSACLNLVFPLARRNSARTRVALRPLTSPMHHSATAKSAVASLGCSACPCWCDSDSKGAAAATTAAVLDAGSWGRFHCPSTCPCAIDLWTAALCQDYYSCSRQALICHFCCAIWWIFHLLVWTC